MSKSPLFALPAELRNKIYEYALIDQDPIPLYFTHRADRITQSCPGPALLQVCHQIRFEATAMYYTNNTFTIKPWNLLRCEPVLEAWLRAIGPETRKFVSTVRMEHLGTELPRIDTEGQWKKCLKRLRKRLARIKGLVEGIDVQVLNQNPRVLLYDWDDEEEEEEEEVQEEKREVWMTL